MALEMVMNMATDPERHDLQHAFGAATRPDDCPCSFKEAMSRSDGDKWLEAAQAEMDALIENGTWELTELPEGRKEVGSRWVFIIKQKADGTIDRYKARLVAKGYSQIPGIDFDQVFSPATRLASLRTVLAQAAMRGEYIESIDVSNAYLNGEIEDQYEVYMTQPEGFKVHSPDGCKWVCKLKKGLYESGRLWYHKLATELENIGFTQIKSDPSIYVWARDGIRVTLPVFVDDITITSKSKSKIREVKDALRKVFKVKDLGPTTYLLGIKVDYNRENQILKLLQTQYIIDILKHFGMEDGTAVTTPMDPGTRLSKYTLSEEEKVKMKHVPYMNAVGALMYLAIATRPDIAYAVAKLAQFNATPGLKHWKAVKHLLRYLQGTKDLKLTYQDNGSGHLASQLFQAYNDADHAGSMWAGAYSMGVWDCHMCYRTLKLRRETGDVVNHTYGLPGQPRLLHFEDVDYLIRLVRHRPDWFLDKLQYLLQTNRFVSVHYVTIHRELERAGMSLKKLKKIAMERDEEKRAEFIIRMAQYQPEQLGFLDEVSKDEQTDYRQRGRSMKGTRAIRKGVFVWGQRFSAEGLLTIDGMVSNTVIEGSMTRESFLAYLEHSVMPLCSAYPGPLSVLVMDNALIHHNPDILELLDQFGVRLEYLLPYSPDLNPIEEAFSKIKAFICRHGDLLARDTNGVMYDLMEIMEIVTEDDALGYFMHSGYC
ncbi:hypothetical protein EST38_g9310 [Candolleomyces aberdarensis]|uniref:Polyprotein n=1 Tax=Candolleomyces aberdarensis TaxID=2316362 RepID=A0A4Q2DCG7_9AGAR|nr:hypothetical protein EST38_g9310 [Candolleomyces aberdarensis]